VKFVKMHGCGYDYVYLDGVTDGAVAALIDQPGWMDIVKRMSDRHKGIGSDGVIVITRPDAAEAHVRMRMFNADGSESEMCGNGVRCVAKFAHDRLGVRANPMLVQTGRGVLSIAYRVENGWLVEATVDMGEPILRLDLVPVDATHLARSQSHAFRLRDDDHEWRFVSMGNPHAVTWLAPKPSLEAVRSQGPGLENHPAFPKRANIHFATMLERNRAEVVTWERGAGITQACGTGACVVLVAGVLAGRLDREATIRVLGGELRIRWDERTNHVFMTGPAEDVCEGTWLGGRSPAPSTIEARTFSTSRLLLRPFTADDATDVSRLAGDRRIAEMTLRLPHPYEPHQALAWIASLDAHRERGTAMVMAICEAGGSLVGAVGLEIDRTHNRAELGYWIGVAYWGKGYATEAAIEMVRFGFEALNLNRIFASHYSANPASGRVLEKAGLKREGVLRQHVQRMGVVHDSVLYGLTRSEWAAQKHRG
jgi:diaminopimelate epimerase